VSYSYNFADKGRDQKMITDMLDDIIKFVQINEVKHLFNHSNKLPEVYLYAHNAGNFDLKVLLKPLYETHIA
jgi:hypothetical protein